ncbi:MAG: hypothetical protein KDE54_09515 [Caldilineaceae bacterium]|nr:hypothetical protein [Caldilineaceae bacterium]
MSPTAETVQIFNLKTMSGVFPGARTQIFQRLRLQNDQDLTRAASSTQETAANGASWAHLQWYDEPAACVIFAAGADEAAPTPLLRIENPQKESVVTRLEEALRPARLMCCGSCRFLTAAPAQTPDAFPTGRCQWRPARQMETNAASQEDASFMAHQSILALGCDHWSSRQAPLVSDRTTTATASSLPPMRKAAEFSAVATKSSAISPWQRFQRFILSLWQAPKDKSRGVQEKSSVASLVERSGVGAGTEPCFVCQGRLANLSALVVESAEGDKQTYSLWRCRNCYSYFLSDWVDRWERLDNLETEEHHYRLAPAEAQLVLAQSAQIKGSDHPAGRQQRTAQRSWFEQFLHDRPPLSHQIKLGR